MIIALIAFIFSLRADARSKATIRMQLYLELKTRFLEVFRGLPAQYADSNWEPADENEELAVKQYWYHAFDEWYITTKLNEKYMKGLWNEYYSSAILGGLKHNGLRKVCGTMFREDEFGIYSSEFLNELTKMWKKTHPGGSSECKGLECTVSHFDGEQEQRIQPAG